MTAGKTQESWTRCSSFIGAWRSIGCIAWLHALFCRAPCSAIHAELHETT